MQAALPLSASRALPVYGWVALACHLAAYLGLWLGVYAVEMLFYPLVWWTYILFIDAVIWKVRGDSLLRNRPWELWVLAFWSIAIWNFFELLNLHLRNWFYVNVPSDLLYGILMSLFAYSTVLPGIFETYDLLRTVKFTERCRIKPRRVTPAALTLLQTCGAAMFIVLLLWPRYAYPLTWVFVTLIVDPICYRIGVRSILRDIEQGDLRTIVYLLLAGLTCGLLWEPWNFWSHTKWIYTVPFLEAVKWFEMPPLGFLGFPPFAIECFVLVNFLNAFRGERTWEPHTESPQKVIRAPRSLATLSAAISLALLFDLAMFIAIDVWTVQSYSPKLQWIRSLPPEVVTRLSQVGITRPKEIVLSTDSEQARRELSVRAGISEESLRSIREECRLIDVQGLGAGHFNALSTLGITTVAGLARQDAEGLLSSWRQAVSRLPVVDYPITMPVVFRAPKQPTLAQVRFWIRAARTLEPSAR